MDAFWLSPDYVWLDADQIIERVDAVIKTDGTAACPYDGRAHLYTGPHKGIYGDGNILNYIHEINNNHERAKFLAPIYNALLIDDMNISRLVLNNVDGTGIGVYSYLKRTHLDLHPTFSDLEADRVMRYVSKYFVDGLYGVITTSVCGAGRDRIFFDTEYPRLSQETADLVTGLAKSKDIETVNDGSIINIRKLWKQDAIEIAYRVICVDEQDKLRRTAWDLASKELMRHYLDVEEFYMIDRQQVWKSASKEVFAGCVDAYDLMCLDSRLNATDKVRKRSPEFCGTPSERFSKKERNLFLFTVNIMLKENYSGLALAGQR
ncbi:MAG: hypothetical protein PHX43_05005 [Alphaproteobacteria bacterium]|nr:hypothetical protein [Alphaproteobacteria bacterium]